MVETVLLIGLASVLAAAGGLGLLQAFGLPQSTGKPTQVDGNTPKIVFLFEGTKLVDISDRAAKFLPPAQKGNDDWARFMSVFAPKFSNLESQITALPDEGNLTLTGNAGQSDFTLLVEKTKGILKIAVIEPRGHKGGDPMERPALEAMRLELETLRRVAETSPVLTWRQQTDNLVTWANSAYIDQVRQEFGEEATFRWPPQNLFPSETLSLEADALASTRRVQRTPNGTKDSLWYDVTVQREETGILCFATPIDDLVRAEGSLRDFIGTLGKTFAQLTIGLAIFDAKRRLVLFNPALIDLTALGAEVLTQRPTLHMFLDALRENQRIPEPRDYKSWRLRIAHLEAAATDGRYQETWTLPTGQTYRVTGQPHPDGAVAFLFEDISAEMSLKRQFRSELDLNQAVFDALPNAVIAFSSDGSVLLTNSAYNELWDVVPNESLTQHTVETAIEHWCLSDAALTFATRLRTFIRNDQNRDAFTATVHAPDGQSLEVRIRALPRRGTLVEFVRPKKAPQLTLNSQAEPA